MTKLVRKNDWPHFLSSNPQASFPPLHFSQPSQQNWLGPYDWPHIFSVFNNKRDPPSSTISHLPFGPDNTRTMEPTTTKQHRLLSFVDSQVNKASKPWCAPILAPVCFVELPQLHIPPKDFSQLNIVDYLKQPLKYTPSGHLYFDSTKYTLGDDQGQAALTHLALDLCHSARDHGFELVRNGTIKRQSTISPHFPARFVCACFRVSSSTSTNHSNVKQTSYHNDRARNRRENGKKKSRKAEVKRPTHSHGLCSFSFTVHCDELGLFIKSSFGNAMHSNHSQLPPASITASIRTINQESRTELEKLARSGMSAAQARNYLHNNEELTIKPN